MSKQKTVVINGREYDIATGLPVGDASGRVTRQSLRSTQPTVAPTKKAAHSVHPATAIHNKTQRSRTLNRKFVKKAHSHNATATQAVPQAQPITVKATPAIKHHPGRRIDGMRTSAPAPGSSARMNLATAKQNIAKRKNLQPVAAAPIVTLQKPTQTAAEPAPIVHPAVARAHAVQSQRKTPVVQKVPSASVLKQAAINEAMDSAPKPSAKQHKAQSRRSKLLSFVSAFSALILFAGYLTYLNVPNLSVRVAAAQAGIDASYPSYQPDGYRLNGPVAYSDGEVRMKFAANTGSNAFTLSQARSSWDSNALLENYVKDKSDGDYITSQERGITVYTYSGKAAWVSGGILYTIDGDAPLSPEQIRKIATSV